MRRRLTSGWTGCTTTPRNRSPRLRLFHAIARRRKGSSAQALRKFLEDPDERLVRLAVREIVRRRPPDFENMLLRLMTNAAPSVRRVISRSIGQSGFDHFWLKFDRLNKPTRKRAGQAMLKLLPDAAQRLQRRLAAGPVEQQLKAMQMVQELGLGASMRSQIIELCGDANPKLRSKAIAVAGEIADVGPEVLVERLVKDTDVRVRANTIEVLEHRRDPRLVPVLASKARESHNRERANAIKALHKLRGGSVNAPLLDMLRNRAANIASRRCGCSGRSASGSCSMRSAASPKRTRTFG